MEGKNGAIHKWQTIKVFISSTFRDFHAERDYLVKYVFPELRQWCEKWKIHLVDIDLRWGVTSEEAESGKVIDICLENIDGARPFFICLLGNRYGWVPDRNVVPPETFARYDRLSGKDGFSITHLEICHAIFQPLSSQEDKEEVPHAFFYFRDPSSLPAPGAITSFSEEERNQYRTAFFESKREYADRLSGLMKEIRDHFGDQSDERIHAYSPVFDPRLRNPEDDRLTGRFTKESLKSFGDRVKSDLKKSLSMRFADRIGALQENREEDRMEAERDYHESFVENRTALFIGRGELLGKLREYVEDDDREILAVLGEPGSGKSALLARFYRDMKIGPDGGEINEDLFFIPHFIGASPQSVSIISSLYYFCELLKKRYGLTGTENEIPLESNRIHECFWKFLEQAACRTVILIDGLNQLDENEDSHSLFWLPRELPEKVKIIASTLEGDTRENLLSRTSRTLTVTRLTDRERREIIRLIPSVFCKTLDESHVAELLRKEETRNPLYLKVALDELRVFGSFEKLQEMIRGLPNDIIDLFVSLLRRLEGDHDPGIVERLFCLLECSRFGLNLEELGELMAETDPDNTYLVILRQVREYLHNRGELIDFFHRSLSKAIRKKYFTEVPA